MTKANLFGAAVAAAMCAFAVPAVAAPSAADSSAQPRDSEPRAERPGERRICVRLQQGGSRIVRPVCKTAQEWEALGGIPTPER